MAAVTFVADELRPRFERSIDERAVSGLWRFASTRTPGGLWVASDSLPPSRIRRYFALRPRPAWLVLREESRCPQAPQRRETSSVRDAPYADVIAHLLRGSFVRRHEASRGRSRRGADVARPKAPAHRLDRRIVTGSVPIRASSARCACQTIHGSAQRSVVVFFEHGLRGSWELLEALARHCGRTSSPDPGGPVHSGRLVIVGVGTNQILAGTASRIQNACRTHAAEGDDPDQVANRYRNEQAERNGCFRHPPTSKLV
jgi:hypothetical protein